MEKKKYNLDEAIEEAKALNIHFTPDFIEKFVDVVYQMIVDIDNEEGGQTNDSRDVR